MVVLKCLMIWISVCRNITYEIYLNSEKPTLNQYEMNKLEGNQKSGKSIFDIKFNESGKPENDGLVEVVLAFQS
jgi:hypothetical protein